MALGEAFVDVRANTAGFAADLDAQIRRIVASANSAAAAAGRAARAATDSAARSAEDSVRAQAAANREALADWRRTTRAIEDAETEAYRVVAEGARNAARAQMDANAEALASWREQAREIAAAETEAYRIVADQARAAARAQADSAAAATAAIRAAAAEQAGASVASTGIIGSAFSDLAGKIQSKFEYAVIKSFRRVAEGVALLDIGIAAFGISSAANLESTEVAFTNLFNGNKTQADDFLKQLRDLANTTAFTFQDVAALSQQFKALTLSNGGNLGTDQILRVLNALAGAGARAGVGLDKVKLAGVALAQIASSARVNAQDLRQLQNALNIPQSEVFKQLAIDLGKVSAAADPKKIAQVGAALKEASAAGTFSPTGTQGLKAAVEVLERGGAAAKALADQSKTFKVELSNIGDIIKQKLGVAFQPALKVLENLLAPEKFVVFDSTINNISRSVSDLTTNLISGFVNNLPKIVSFITSVNTGFEATLTGLGRVVDFLKTLQPEFDAVGQTLVVAFGLVRDVAANLNSLGFVAGLKDVAGVLIAITAGLQALVDSNAGPAIEVIATALAAFSITIFLLNTRLGLLATNLVLATIEFASLATAEGLATAGAIALSAALDASPVGIVVAGFVSLLYILKNIKLALNLLGDAVAFTFKGIVNIVLGTVESIVFALNNTLGRIPGVNKVLHLDDAVRGIDAVRTQLNGVIDVALSHTQFNLDTTVAQSNLIALDALGRRVRGNVFANASAAAKATANSAEGVPSTAAEITQQLNSQGFFAKLPTDTGGGAVKSGGGGGGAASAAKTAANTFADRIKNILATLNKDFENTLVNGAGKAISDALSSLRKAIQTAFKGKNTGIDDALISLIKKDNDKLRVLATERDSIIKRLADATAEATKVAKATVDFANITSLDFNAAANATANAVKKINTATLDVAGSFVVTSRTLQSSANGATDAVKHTADEFAAALQARLDAIKKFQDEIKILVGKGLNKETIDQIISAGVAGGGATAEALAGASAQTITLINKTQAAIDSAATHLGNTAADSLFRAGTNVVDGLIAGLKSRKGEIAAAMTDIAETLINRIRKDLKIHSPSRVFRQLFQFVGSGAALGLDDMVTHVGAAGSRLAQASIPALAPVSLPALQAAGNGQALSALRQSQASNGSLDTAAIVAALQGARASKEIHAPQTFHIQAQGLTVDQLHAGLSARVSRSVRR